MVAFNYPQPLLSGPPAGHHRDMTKYLISFPSEAMVLTDGEFPIVSAESDAVIEDGGALIERVRADRWPQ
jgi:hypothetical protein